MNNRSVKHINSPGTYDGKWQDMVVNESATIRGSVENHIVVNRDVVATVQGHLSARAEIHRSSILAVFGSVEFKNNQFMDPSGLVVVAGLVMLKPTDKALLPKDGGLYRVAAGTLFRQGTVSWRLNANGSVSQLKGEEAKTNKVSGEWLEYRPLTNRFEPVA